MNMKKNIYYYMTVLLAGLLFGACSSSDNDSNGNGSNNATYTETAQSEAPAWQVDWNNNQERPDWTEPDESAYENWTILKVQIEEALRPFVSEGDLLALFVNGELRGLAKTAVNLANGQTANGKFLIKAYGNETGTETLHMSLQYYSQTLKHIFTLSEDISLSTDVTIGIDENYIPEFTAGSAKYPVQNAVGVETLLTKAGITPSSGSTAGAFVGDECRGTASLSASGNTSMVIYGRSAGETVTLKYYDAEKGLLYTIPDVVRLF